MQIYLKYFKSYSYFSTDFHPQKWPGFHDVNDINTLAKDKQLESKAKY